MDAQVHAREPHGADHRAQGGDEPDARGATPDPVPHEPDEQTEEGHGRHGVAGGEAEPADIDQAQGDVGAGALDGKFERLVEQGRTDQVGRAKRAHAADPARAAAEGDDEDARDQRDRRDDERDRLHDGREPRGAHMLHHELDGRAVERHDLPGQHAVEQDDEHEQARGCDHDAAVLVEKRPRARAEPLRVGVPREALPRNAVRLSPFVCHGTSIGLASIEHVVPFPWRHSTPRVPKQRVFAKPTAPRGV